MFKFVKKLKQVRMRFGDVQRKTYLDCTKHGVGERLLLDINSYRLNP